MVEFAQKILDSIKIKDVQNKIAKNLFETEKKAIDKFYNYNNFLQSFVEDFKENKEINSNILEKYQKIFSNKKILEEKKEKPIAFVLDNILEKVIFSEEEYNDKKKICLNFVKNEERFFKFLE